jgi:hypothetical protein
MICIEGGVARIDELMKAGGVSGKPAWLLPWLWAKLFGCGIV